MIGLKGLLWATLSAGALGGSITGISLGLKNFVGSKASEGKLNPDESETKKEEVKKVEISNLMWEYVRSYDQDSHSCKLKEKSQQEQEVIFREEGEPICNTSWTKNIIAKNKGKLGLWVRGEENSINQMLSEESLFSIFEQWSGVRENEISTAQKIKDSLQRYCKVENLESENSQLIQISCLSEGLER